MSHTSRPFPAATLSGRLRLWLNESPIFDASGRDHSRANGGCVGSRRARVSGLLGAIVALGVRALTRGAAGRRDTAAHPAAGALRRVRDDARALSLVDGSAPARRGGGDRRSAAPGCRRRRASTDRQASAAARGHGPWLAARRPPRRGEFARVRDPADRCVGPRTGRDRPGRQRAGRCGRGDHACRSGVGAAVRSRRDRPVGARGMADGRAAARSPTAAAVGPFLAVVPPARPGRHPAAHGGGSSAATTVRGFSRASVGA